MPKVDNGRTITIRARRWTGQILNNQKILYEEDKDGDDYFIIHRDLNAAREYAIKEIEDRFIQVSILDEHGNKIETHRNPKPGVPSTLRLILWFVRYLYIRNFKSRTKSN